VKMLRNLSWICVPFLFAVVTILSGALIVPAAMAQEEKAVESFPAVLQREITLWSDGTRLSGVLLYPRDREVVDPFDQQEDIDAALSYIHGEPMVDKDRIGIWGTSFGGGHVIYRAAHDSRIACVVAQVGAMPDDWTKRFPAGLSGIYKQKSDRARGLSDPVPQGGDSPGVLKGTPYSERIAVFNPGQYADRVKVPPLLIDAEKEHYFKIKENSERVHDILKKNGVPTEYHVLKGIAHYDVYSGQCLDDVIKLEIAWFDKYLKK